jgi:hypothetical protein
VIKDVVEGNTYVKGTAIVREVIRMRKKISLKLQLVPKHQ